jgi:hypothetical protein
MKNDSCPLFYCEHILSTFLYMPGRLTNAVPLASRDLGRASPPPSHDSPPKYGPPIYEDAGKALGVSVLDLTEANPWTRLTCSSCKNLKGVRAWLRNYLKTAEAEAMAAAAKAKAAKASPMRTRLRSLSSLKKSSIVKQLKLPKSSPSSPDAGGGSRPPPSKMPRKIIPPKNAQSASAAGKLMRQLSAVASSGSSSSLKAAFSADSPAAAAQRFNRVASLARVGAGSVKKLKRPGSKGSSSRSGSKPGSRASSPRRLKQPAEAAGGAAAVAARKKIGVPAAGVGGKKSWGRVEAGLPPLEAMPIKKVKKKKKTRVPSAK